jgi:hypothetical protein
MWQIEAPNRYIHANAKALWYNPCGCQYGIPV